MKCYRKPRVVVSYIEAGMGHIVSAKAISDELKKNYGDKIDVVDLYFSKESKILKNYEKFLVDNVKRANKNAANSYMQFFFMNVFGKESSLKFVHNTTLLEYKNEMMKVFARKRPDMIVSTHFSPHHAAIELRNSHLNNMIVATYNPDPNVHGWWDNRADLFFVNNKYAKKQAIQDSKFLPLNVRQVGFTARENILNCNLTKEECRELHDLPQDKFTIILADGAYATSKLKIYANELCKSKKPMTLIIIAGKNKTVKEYFEAKQKTLPKNITLKVFGYVDNIQELYRASDLFVTKAGPNAIQDSIFLGTPVLVNFFASPIENFTQKFFNNECGCGDTIMDKVKARKQIEKWIDNPELLRPYIENCHKFDNSKYGATEIAHEIYRTLKYHKPNLFEED